MATYINLGNEAFSRCLNGEYVDKTGLIAEINKTLFADACFSCVSRCRRFGKSMAAKMLCAYYDRSCCSRELFSGLSIEKHPDFEKHLNKYPVIYVDMTNFLAGYGHNNRIANIIERDLKEALHEEYPQVEMKRNDGLMTLLKRIADMVFVPWRNVDLPAIVVELKWKQDALTALRQIRERNYPEPLKEYTGKVILCGISYDPTSKQHTCVIERT